MIGFSEVNLINLLKTLEEEQVKNILLNFKSPLNKDIEGFLHNKAIEFYETNGFVSFGSRPLDKDETNSLDGTYLVQLLKKL